MKQMKIFPKTFLYTLGLMLFIVGIAHLLLYLFTKPEWLVISISPQDNQYFNASLNVADYVTQAVLCALPLSLICCVVISIACSFVFSRKITVPIKQMGAVTEQMAQIEKDAACKIDSKDEIGMLAENINHLYRSLLSAMESLEAEKRRVSESERSKADFLRAASHELKTPVTALNATLENMILGVGKYKDYDTYLPECREMTGQLGDMIHDILETSKAGMCAENETAIEVDLSKLLFSLCEPYALIARAKGVIFRLELPDSFQRVLPPQMFRKAVSNILANAVAYTEPGGRVLAFFDGHDFLIENECIPIPEESLRHIFEPFYRPDFARDRDKGGNGLGLYIVDTLLKAMDISYSFCPMEEPQGMRFIIHM
ncbi:MAG: HAMP domain-containing histidine kinase [Lachnospiraceae bacterium]|jgi:signal transduction histidine kinase|nr:HAMP domain-containing histidine kinase [Lachnospiraceae bacterium]